ncbi:MAG: 3,4-dihydroxy-2-butanone-4-phosphate synthase [Bauldia sp.]
MKDAIERVAYALRAFEQGQIVIVTDDADRENEADLIVAGVHATPDKLALIVRHTSGIVCAPIPADLAQRLNLTPMVAENDAPHGTAFTISIDYRRGLTSGISAEERANTIKALADPAAAAGDFVRPGHVFPLIAREGGVLIRSGHTEAAVDLCRLTNLPPVAAICELVNDDGTVMRGSQVTDFADTWRFPIVSVADIISWRQRRERLVERVDEFTLTTAAGPATAISYRTPFDPMQHLAIVVGDIRDGSGVLARLHREQVAEDVFGEGGSLAKSMERIRKEGRGVVIYLREGAAGVSPGRGAAAHATPTAREEEWREIGLGAQILKDLGVTSIRLLAHRERRYVGLDGFGIAIQATEKLDG